MSFTLHSSHPHTSHNPVLENLRVFDLEARCMIWVEAMAFANIPHGYTVKPGDRPVILIPLATYLVTKSLVIGVCCVKAGEVVTQVFNLSYSPLKIKKGEVISMLVEV